MGRRPVKKLLAVAVFLWSMGNGIGFGRPRPQPTAPRQAFAVRYGILKDFPLAALVAGADRTARLDIALMVWVVRDGQRVVLVDAGFYRPMFVERWKPAEYLRPDRAVARLGIQPDQVTDVIITHAHWDHLDGADLFPRARVWIQRAEYEYYRQPAHQQRTGVYAVDMQMLEAIARQKRLRLLEGDQKDILPGISVYLGGRHTYASQYVVVEAGPGPIVFASDNAYLFRNLERQVPIAQTLDPAANRAALERMLALAGPHGVVIPGHDPEVFTRFRQLLPGVVEILP